MGKFMWRTGISIHAPLRERLKVSKGETNTVLISIHAPLRERHGAKYKIPRYYHFNPRSLTGATSLLKIIKTPETNFNPRSLTGATTIEITILTAAKFQSTLPYGSDHMAKASPASESDFNPRSLTGAT